MNLAHKLMIGLALWMFACSMLTLLWVGIARNMKKGSTR